jgi:ribonuclease Z
MTSLTKSRRLAVGLADRTLWQPAAAIKVIGPSGTTALMAGLEQAYSWDIRIRAEEQKMSKAGVAVDAIDLPEEGIAYERDGVKITAIEVYHGGLLKPAYGFWIDYRGRSAVISGDTSFSKNLINKSAGTDLVVHEVHVTSPNS